MADRSPRSRRTGGVRLLVSLLIIATTVACGDDPQAEPQASATPTIKSPSALPTQPKATHPSIIATISTGEGPITLAASAEDLWVELHRENHVARIDPTTNEQVEVLDVPPVHCSIAATDQSVWTAIFDGRRVSRVDVATGQVVQTADIPGCLMTVEGDSAWVVSPSTGDVYRLVEGREGVVEQHHIGDQTFVPALTEKHLWVTSEADGGTLLRMDRATHRVTTVGKFPLVDSLVVAFGHLWAGSRDGGYVWKLDPVTGRVLGELSQYPAGLVEHAGRLWLATPGGSLVSIDPKTLDELSSVDLGHRSLQPPISAFGSLWTSALEEHVVLRIDPSLAE